MSGIDRRVMLGIAGLTGVAVASQLTKAGSLNPPPGPVAPTGKTTDQIEPRVDLLNAPASANVTTNDGTFDYIINNPGSYYLSANLAVVRTSGIKINAVGVTLDLSGFQVSVANSDPNVSYGILIVANGAVLRNGSVTGGTVGIDSADLCSFSNLSVSACQNVGIDAGNFCSIESCIATNCVNGISCEDQCVLTNCIAVGNTFAGIYAGSSCVLSRCVANSNGSDSGSGVGIFANQGSTLVECNANSNNNFGITAYQSTLRNCAATDNHAPTGLAGGFYLIGCTTHDCCAYSNTSSGTKKNVTGVGFYCAGGLLDGCESIFNGGDGILVGDTATSITNCSSFTNIFAGIHVTASTCLIRGNHVTNNATNGLLIDSKVNAVVGNYARSNNAGNYSIVAGNRVATIVSPALCADISGNTGGTAFSTDASSNVAY